MIRESYDATRLRSAASPQQTGDGAASRAARPTTVLHFHRGAKTREALLTRMTHQLRTPVEIMALSVEMAARKLPAAPVSVAEVAKQVVDRWRDAASRQDIALSLIVETNGKVRADPLILGRLLGKLIAIMIEFEQCSEVTITVACGDSRTAPARLVATCNGVAIQPSHSGLPVVEALALDMECSFDADGDPVRGSRFEISFPD